MRRPQHTALLIALAALGLTACGGGGGGSDNSNNGSTPVSTVLTGTFTDAPTQGLEYSALPSGFSGVTDADGHFQFKAGDTVSFSLPLGNGQSLDLGSVPAGGGQVFVLSLPHGPQIAQVLQALDHSGKASQLNLSNLNLPLADIKSLKDFIDSEGIVLPAGQTWPQLVAAARSHNSTGVSFTLAQAPDLTQALATAAKSSQFLLTGNTDAGGIVRGHLVYHSSVGSKTAGDTTTLVRNAGINYFKADGTGFAFRLQKNISFDYTSAGNTIDLGGGYFIKLAGNAEGGMYSAVDPGKGVTTIGAYRVLKNTLKRADFLNRTFSISGGTGCGPRAPMILAVDNNGRWSSYCDSSNGFAPGHTVRLANGSVLPLKDTPGLLSIHNDGGYYPHLVALASGTLQDGTIAVSTMGHYADGRAELLRIREIHPETTYEILPLSGSAPEYNQADGLVAAPLWTIGTRVNFSNCANGCVNAVTLAFNIGGVTSLVPVTANKANNGQAEEHNIYEPGNRGALGAPFSVQLQGDPNHKCSLNIGRGYVGISAQGPYPQEPQVVVDCQ